MGTQLSKITRPLPLISRTLRHGFERTGRTPRVQADTAPRSGIGAKSGYVMYF